MFSETLAFPPARGGNEPQMGSTTAISKFRNEAAVRYACIHQDTTYRRAMEHFWTWWIVAAALIGAELLSGTFYLLAIGVAVGLGGVAAWLGASEPMQFAVAGVLGVVLTIVAHRWRIAHATPPQQPGLDIGQAVQVLQWNPDGTARVAYRGSEWDAELATPEAERAATMYISATRANTLVLTGRKPAR